MFFLSCQAGGRPIPELKRRILEYTRDKVAASELRSLSAAPPKSSDRSLQKARNLGGLPILRFIGSEVQVPASRRIGNWLTKSGRHRKLPNECWQFEAKYRERLLLPGASVCYSQLSEGLISGTSEA
jgi:hypothetical protein